MNAVVNDQHTYPTRSHGHTVSHARGQSELYSISAPIRCLTSFLSMSSNAQGETNGQMRKLTESPRGTEQLGVAMTRIGIVNRRVKETITKVTRGCWDTVERSQQNAKMPRTQTRTNNCATPRRTMWTTEEVNKIACVHDNHYWWEQQ